MSLRHPNRPDQHGIALIEALVALLVLALGVLGLARLQVSSLTESRNTNARAMAVQLAADLAERMQSNAPVRRTSPDPNPYETLWGVPAAAGTNCLTTSCNGGELAAFDLRAWKQNVQTLLPNGDALVFRSNTDRNQFGVLMRWAEFEARNESQATAAEAALFSRADDVTDATGAVGTGRADVTCPPGFTCHLVYNLAAMQAEGATYGQFTGAQPAAAGNALLTAGRAWYWVEVFRYSTNYGAGAASSAPVPVAQHPYVYRITAFVQGAKPGTQVRLRSTFVPFLARDFQ